MAIIVNPAAGTGRCGRRWPALARELEAAGIAFEASLTQGPGDATRLTAAALRSGATTVVAVGGDGTANEVANGFFEGDESINPAARFGLIPVGTGSDLARTLGLRGRAAVAALGADGRTGVLDVVQVEFTGYDGQRRRRRFVNVADLGIGGETAALTRQGTKAFGGSLGFLFGAVRAILQHRARLVRYTIDDGPPTSARIATIFVANGRYLAGGMFVAPPAVPDDGEFDVLVAREVGKLDLLFRLLPAIYRGAHLQHPAVQHCRARRVCVETSERLLLQLDGEQPGMAPAEFVMCPQALPVALPPAEPMADRAVPRR